VRHVDVQVLTLPCQRARHAACAGTVTIGFALGRTSHGCLCHCHQVAQDVLIELALHTQLSPA
jgi:hypothetical protein